jgi:2-keto-4-pentenoate hydratase
MQDSVTAFVDARSKRPNAPLIDPSLRPKTLDDAYRLQAAIHQRLIASGDTRVGWKVGSTSAAGQRGFGLSEPVYAGLFASGRSASLAKALAQPMIQPSLECEIAVVLRQDLQGTESDAVIKDAVAKCCIACEIIDNRYADPKALGVPTLIADDFFQVGFVVGADNTQWQAQDLTVADGFIEIAGQRRTGSARDVLSAFDSLRWLAQALARNGHTLRAGELVLTGTLVPPTPIALPASQVAMGITGFETLAL